MKYIVMLVLLFGLLEFQAKAPTTEAGLFDRQWVDDEIDFVRNGTSDLLSRTSNLQAKLDNIPGSFNCWIIGAQSGNVS